MLRQTLGILDLTSLIVLLFNSLLNPLFLIITSSYLTVKGIIFASQGNKISLGDSLCGIYGFFIIAGYSHLLLTIIAIAFLGQKTLLSLLN